MQTYIINSVLVLSVIIADQPCKSTAEVFVKYLSQETALRYIQNDISAAWKHQVKHNTIFHQDNDVLPDRCPTLHLVFIFLNNTENVKKV